MQHFRRERPTTFLDLPAEIRIEIYNLLLVERQTVRIPERLRNNGVDFNVYPHVLRVCKQIHAEAAPAFYGRNEMRLLFYGGDDIPHQRCRSGFLSLSKGWNPLSQACQKTRADRFRREGANSG